MPSKRVYDKPLAAPGLTSYRYPSNYSGYVMIGAKDNADAMREAKRSIEGIPDPARLEIWNGTTYTPASSLTRYNTRTAEGI